MRLRSNVLAGLLHDLPEALTRDIISPVKSAIEGLPTAIRDFEKKEVEEQLLPLLPEAWRATIEFLLGGDDEFANRVLVDGEQVSPEPEIEEIGESYAESDAIDGRVLKVCDDLVALMQASMSMRYGTSTPDLEEGKMGLLRKYKKPTDPALMKLSPYLEKHGLLQLFDYFA